MYLHVPFCDRVCPYCDFAVVAARGGPEADVEDRYVKALEAELAARADAFAGRGLASLYLGGGTPALLRPDSIARLVERVRQTFHRAGEGPGEITLEVNPSTVERERLSGFRAAGVTRLSVGVQSFDDEVLRRLGRAHRSIEADRTLDAARAAGFEDVSVDLMFAVPGQTLETIVADLQRLARHRPEHASTYELVVEAGTPFATAAERGQLAAFDADVAADMLDRLEAGLADLGLQRYELTNYARPGHASVHNRRYWARQPVLGLGVGAWSFDPPGPDAPYGARPANPRALGAWQSAVEAGAPAAERVDVPDRREAMGEAVFLALRCRDGLDPADFEREFGATLEHAFEAELEELVRLGWLEGGGGEPWRLTAAGRMWADAVGSRFV